MAELAVLDKAKALPSGYTELEYIQSNDNHPRIEVDSIKNIAENEIEFQTQIMWVGSSINNGGTLEIGFGSSSSSSYDAIRTFGVTYDGYWKTNQTKITPNKRASTNILYDISYKMYSNKVILEVKNGDTTEVNSTVNYNIPFDGNSIFYPTDYMGYGLRSARIYFSKVYRDGVLVFNGMPAKRNSDNAVGLYDIIGNTFYKQIASQSSSGYNFIAGPEILPEYSSVIPVVLAGTGHSNKKYDLYDRVKTDTIVYTELEYLELQGEACFNTNVYLSKDMDIEFETMLIQIGNEGRFGGARKISNEGGFLFVYNYQNSGINNVIVDFFGRNATGSTPNTSRWIIQNSGSDYVPETNKKYKLSIINKVGSFSVDGVSISTHTYVGNGESPNDVPLYIGATNSAGTVYTNESNINWRFYHFSATGVADIVPVRRNDGVLGLYNKTTGEFLEKIGNGTLVAGPVVSTITSESKDIGIVVGFQLDQEDNEYAVVCLNAEYRIFGDIIDSENLVTVGSTWGENTAWLIKETGTYQTQKLIDFITNNPAYHSSGATHARSKSFVIDGITYQGQLPNYPEIIMISKNITKINKNDPTKSSYFDKIIPIVPQEGSFATFGSVTWYVLRSNGTVQPSQNVYLIRQNGMTGAGFPGRDIELLNKLIVPILELPNPEL